jgi:hypothetical protein
VFVPKELSQSPTDHHVLYLRKTIYSFWAWWAVADSNAMSWFILGTSIPDLYYEEVESLHGAWDPLNIPSGQNAQKYAAQNTT